MRFFSVPDPRQSVPQWHLSPAIDTAAYAFSWAWILVPLLFSGSDFSDYVLWFLITMALTDVHRHFGLPYVYLDREIRQRHTLRFWLFPAVCLLAWISSPWLVRMRTPIETSHLAAALAWIVVLVMLLRLDRDDHRSRRMELMASLLPLSLAVLLTQAPGLHNLEQIGPVLWWASALIAALGLDALRWRRRGRHLFFGTAAIALIGALAWSFGASIDDASGGLQLRPVVNSVAVVAGIWNFWHVHMQKYGILRMYSAKSGTASKVPAWVDRWFILAWLPLFFAYLGPLYRDVAFERFSRARHVLPDAINALEYAAPVTVPISIALLLLAHAFFLGHEWRAHRIRNRPRLVMAMGTTLLSSCFLFVDPIKVYIAFAFSHAVEYIVFVWAFQRRRYADPLPHRPLLQRVLSRPLMYYASIILGIGSLFLVLKYTGRYIFTDTEQPRAFGIRTQEWMSFWGVYQSLVHFYFDGFLWKMRSGTVRSSI